MTLDADLAIRSALMQGVLVAIVAVIMMVVAPGDFFESWGWLTGPLAWLGCATLVSLRLTIPTFQALMGAVGAGVPMLIALAVGLHWIGVIVGLIVFGLWCGTLEPRVPRRPTVVRRRHSELREPLESFGPQGSDSDS